MDQDQELHHILIRDAGILVQIPRQAWKSGDLEHARFFDVRTGVQIKEIHPPLQPSELARGYVLSLDSAEAIINSGAAGWIGPSVDFSKVVSIHEVRQRRLDTVVADSVLDQLHTIVTILQDFLKIAEDAQREERLWLSQQVLTLIGKFSGREMEELEEITEWFKNKPRK
jgi:hypothetical protein